MKTYYIFFFTLLFLSGFSQRKNLDYSFLQTDQISYFSSHENGDVPKGIKIEQQIPTDSGTIYRSYNMGAFLYWEGEGPTYNGPYSSFIGDQALVKENGAMNIYSCRGKTFYFKEFGYSGRWLFYEEETQARIEAEYTQNVYREIADDLYDSCAVINLYAYDSLGYLMTDHFLSGFQFVVSKNYGLVTTFGINYFSKFYMDSDFEYYPRFYHLIGIDKENEQYGYNFRFYEDLVKSVEIGTIMHYTYDENHGDYESITKVIDKIVDDSTCTYVYKIYKRKKFSVHYDSMVVNKSYSYKMLPSQTLGKGDTLNWSGVYVIYFNDYNRELSRPYVQYIKWEYIRDIESPDVWRIISHVSGSMGTMGYYLFYEGLGEIIGEAGEDHPGYEIDYYKTPTEEWGTPYDFFSGINDIGQSNINIYPNPADNYIHLNFKNKQINNIHFVNLQGKLVLTKEVQGGIDNISIDISALNSGVYFVELINNNQTTERKKLIIK